MPRADGRPELLDAAERLFGEHGIPLVSDRKIAEAAGNKNHSAVSYYFGGRTGLLEALLVRHLEGLETERKRLFDESDSVLGDIRALVTPVTSAFAALPWPSWRARFLRQAYNDPTAVAVLRGTADHAPVAEAVLLSLAARLDHLDPRVVEARLRIMVQIITTACADIEQRSADEATAPWSQAADLLCDAVRGMLEAPVSR